MTKSIKDQYLARLVRYIRDKKIRDAIIAASKEREVPHNEEEVEEVVEEDLDSN